MIKSKEFLNTFKIKNKFFYRCTDFSSSLCSKLEKNSQHYPAPNEGSAIGLAIGYHLSTNKLPLVYLQNSGLEILSIQLHHSLTKKYLRSLFLIIGWLVKLKKQTN